VWLFVGRQGLKNLPRGSQRRMIHDDICATVIHFDFGPGT
jgi:hypothetical protein